jgi:transcriptional regulator with XRE-family HTH domain
LRKRNGLTGEKLSELLNISPQAVSKWENGKSLPETALLPALAKILKCTIDELLIPTGVVFINPLIEKAVRKKLDKETEELTEVDILSVTKLELNGLGLTDIRDLEQFKNLVEHNVESNSLTDLTPISSLVSLIKLYAGNDPFAEKEDKKKQNNNYKNLDAIKNLINLREIRFNFCGLVDITPLGYLRNLEKAWLYSNKIEDITPINLP